MDRMKLIGLEDLPDNFRIGLEEDFRVELFNRAARISVKVKHLAETLKCCDNTILNLRKGISFIKIETIKKISEITQIPLGKIEEYVIELKTRNKKCRVKVKFPVFSSEELASIVGHSIGDGSLNDRQFSFFNRCKELIDEVEINMKKAFSTDIKPKKFEKNEGWEIEFPTSIARLLLLVGAPKGKKVFKNFRVPYWIRNGSKKIKISFIRALFDDEGWIKIKRNPKTKSTKRIIGMNMAKNETFLESHKIFLEDVRKLLYELNISSSKVAYMGKTKNGISLGFVISNFKNLKLFSEIVNFSNPLKRQKLFDCLDSFKRIISKV